MVERQVNQCLKHHLCPRQQGAVEVRDGPPHVSFLTVQPPETRLLAREYFMEFSYCESSKLYTVSEKDCTLFFIFFFLGAQCVESGVSCTDWY